MLGSFLPRTVRSRSAASPHRLLANFDASTALRSAERGHCRALIAASERRPPGRQPRWFADAIAHLSRRVPTQLIHSDARNRLELRPPAHDRMTYDAAVMCGFAALPPRRGAHDPDRPQPNELVEVALPGR